MTERGRLEQTVRSQRGMLRVQGDEIVSLRRRLKAREKQIATLERTNGRLAKDLTAAWEFLWHVAGNALSAGNARNGARRLLLNARSASRDR